MSDAVLSVEIRAKLDQLSKGLAQAGTTLDKFVDDGNRKISLIESKFKSLGNSTKEIAENLQSSLGGISLDRLFQMNGDKDSQIGKLTSEIKVYKEEVVRLTKASEELQSKINLNKVALNDAKAATEAQRKATEAERTEAQRLKNEITELTLARKRNDESLKGATQAYRSLSAELNKSRNEAKNYAADMFRLEQAGQKNTAAYKMLETRFNSVASSVTKLDGALKKIDGSLGQHQRKVGQYENAMGNVNNVSQEFARIIQDAPFGMRGIANNIQQLTTNWGYYVQEVRQANAEQGKVTTTGGLLKGVLSNMISPVNLLTIGIAAVTSGWVAYEMWTQRAEKAAEKKQKAIEKTKNALQTYLDTINSVTAAQLDAEKAGAREANKLDILWKAYNNTSLSQKERLAALKEIMSQNPAYFNELKDEELFTNKVTLAYKKLRSSIILAARARAYQDRIAKNEDSLIDENSFIEDLEKRIAHLNSKVSQHTKDLYKRVLSGEDSGQSLMGVNKEELKAHDESLKLQTQLNKRKRERFILNRQNLILEDKATKIQEDQLKFLKLEQDFENNKNNDTKDFQNEQNNIESYNDKRIKERKALDKILQSSIESISNTELSGIEKIVSTINQKYDSWKRQALDSVEFSKDASETIAELEKNNKYETMQAINKMVMDSLKKQKKDSIKAAQEIADSNKKIAIDKINVELVYSRKFNETSSQLALRRLNEEYKELEKDLEKKLKGQVSFGVTNIDVDNRQGKLQEEYFEKYEKIYQQEQKMKVDMADSRGLFNTALERTNILLDEAARKYQAGAISLEQFKDVQTSLLDQQDALNALKSVYDQFTSGVGDAFADMLTKGTSFKDGMESLFKSLVSSIIQQFARLATIKLFGALFTGGASLLLPGFASGGYTGNIAANKPAGIVHGKEFVFDAESTKRIGVDNLNAIKSGKSIGVSDFTPRIAKNFSSFTANNLASSNKSISVDVTMEGKVRNNSIEYSSRRAKRSYRKFGRGV